MYPNYYFQQPNQLDQYKQPYMNPYGQQNQTMMSTQVTTINATDLEHIHKLTDTIKNIDKIKHIEKNGYSADGGWRAEGMYSRNSYDMDDSYGRHYVRGHYSMDDGKRDIMQRIDSMMDDPNMSQQDRMALSRAREQLNR